MFRFLIGVAFGAAGYWAWQSFGRDLLGMGNDQETTYGGFNSNSNITSPTSGGSFGVTNPITPTTPSSDPTTAPTSGSTN